MSEASSGFDEIEIGPRLTRASIAGELRRMRAVRLQLVEAHPFWGHLLLHVQLVPAPELDAVAATDCIRHIWFNPNFTRHLCVAQVAFVLCHEVGHLLLATQPRQRGRDPYLWNCATDYAINRVVFDMALKTQPAGSLQLPDGCYPDIGVIEVLLDERFDGMPAEAIYEHLLAERDAEEQPIAGGATVHISLPSATARQRGVDVEVAGHHGGGLDVHLPAGLDPDGLDEADVEAIAERLTAAVEAWQQAGSLRELPAPLLREARPLGRSVVPWQRVLHRHAGTCLSRPEYALHRPNRRFLLEDVVVSGLVDEGLPRLVVAVDTSGSMDAAALDAAATELAALSVWTAELTVLVGDSGVREVIQTEELPAFLRARRMLGGGGTDHRPIFAWIAEHLHPPDLFVGLTDLHSRFPPEKPAFPVLWITPQRHGEAPWGEILAVPEPKKILCSQKKRSPAEISIGAVR